MDMDLDSALRRLAEQPLHPRLAELEGDVMRLIAAEQHAGGGLSSAAATAQMPTLTPFGPAVPLAPSTLLAFQ